MIQESLKIRFEERDKHDIFTKEIHLGSRYIAEEAVEERCRRRDEKIAKEAVKIRDQRRRLRQEEEAVSNLSESLGEEEQNDESIDESTDESIKDSGRDRECDRDRGPEEKTERRARRGTRRGTRKKTERGARKKREKKTSMLMRMKIGDNEMKISMFKNISTMIVSAFNIIKFPDRNLSKSHHSKTINRT